MGRKWTNITFELKEPYKNVREASSDPRTREEVFHNFIIEEWSDDNIAPDDQITIMFGTVGRKKNKLENYLEKIFKKFDWVEMCAVIYITDHAYSGSGEVYVNNNGSPNKISSYKGYEGARGHDVAEKISEEYNIQPTAEFYW